MQEYDNNMRGVLFQNKKEKETQPDYKGSCEIDGNEYWISGWKKLSKANAPFLSLSIQVKDTPTPVKPEANQSKVIDDDPINLDDIPF
tara:strand:+ start:177 stop:440 length:264 start_codon:yes stop_codon:yes gene_type:complete